MAKPKGYSRDRKGFRAHVRVGTQRRTKRFKNVGDPSEILKRIREWRDETRVALRKTQPEKPESESLTAEIPRYLAQVKTMPTYQQREDHLWAWADALGRKTPRTAVTPERIRGVLHEWHATLSAATCNKRRSALMHMFTILDGKDARNPVRAVKKFRVADPLPRGRNFAQLRAKLDAMPDTRTKARLLVMFWCGMRPAEVMRAEPDDVNQRDRYIIVRTAKGGRTRNVPLTPAAVKAWKLFDELDAWGTFTVAPMGRMLKKATGLDMRVYDVRHTYGTALARQGARLDTIAELMGQSSLEITKRYLLAAVGPEAAAATQRLTRSAGGGHRG